MGRHGGGSRSGGSRSSSSRSGGRGGSRGGGSGVKTSNKPFYGCYNRSYVDRKGRLRIVYTNNANFGTTNGWSIGTIIALAFLTFHMCVMVGIFSLFLFDLGGKVNGNASRIFIEDNSNLLSEEQEKDVIELFNKVYDKSGMPITLYTENFDWRDHYNSIEIYSEELYYKLGMEEDAMVILFTSEDIDGFWDWEYVMYCGDKTINCFSNEEFDTLLSNFQKSMAKGDLAYALDYSWNSVIDQMGEGDGKLNLEMLPVIIGLLIFYSVFYICIFAGVRRKNRIYKYFQENPDKLSMTPMTLYSECPNCGAPNTSQTETCSYCGSLLKIEDGTKKFVSSN